MTEPDHVFEPEVFRITPFPEIPVPEIEIGSVIPVRPPETPIAAPFATDVDDRDDPLSPSEVFVDMATTPVETVVKPV